MGELGPSQPLDKTALEDRARAAGGFPKKPIGFFTTSE